MLSLCLIARDEEKLLPACLASVAGVVDEIIVADTGSVDGTVQVAKAHGASVVHHVWDDDFAAARNCALNHSRGDWVLVLDADERLAPGAAEALKRAIAQDDLDLGMLPLHNAERLDATDAEVLDGSARRGEAVWLPRLFRRSPALRWEGRVHETPRSWLESNPRVRKVHADIVHMGNVPSVRESRDKAQRNLRLLERRCQEEPERSTAWTYLAYERIHSGDEAGAREAIERGWEALKVEMTSKGVRPTFVSLVSVRVHLQLRANDAEEALATLEQAQIWGAKHPNVPFLRGHALEQLGRLDEALQSFTQATEFDGTPSEEVLPGAMTWGSMTRMAELSLALGRPSRRQWEDVIQVGHDTLEVRLGLAEAMLREGQPAEAISAIEGQLAHDTPDGWVIAALSCSAIGQPDDAVAFIRTAMARSLDASWVSARRREMLEDLRAEMQLYEGRVPVGDTVAGRLGALIGRQPLDVQPLPSDRAVSITTNLIRIGRSDLLEPLLEPRADELFAGFHDELLRTLESLGATISDDGEPDFVFIGGAGRSGTTLFRTMLGAHERFWCGPELKLVSAICSLRDQWMSSMGADLKAAGVTDAVLDGAVRAFVKTLLEQTGQGERIAEKTPHNLLHMATLARLFPKARFIHVIRDGRAVAASLVRQRWMDPSSGKPIWYCQDLTQASRYWAQVVESVHAQSRVVKGRYLEVRYEDLVENPEPTMRKVCAFLGEKWDPAMLKHEQAGVAQSARESSTAAVSEAVHTRALDRWRKEHGDMSGKLDSAAVPLLTRLGYADTEAA